MSLQLQRLLPDLPRVSCRERVRVTLGALLGLLVTATVCRAALGGDPALPALVAPMGASAVLLFAVPSSPLAQPWSVLGGNLVASLLGVATARLVPDPLIAAALAGAAAIALMLALRCLHPPSGAVALTAVLGGPAIGDLGYGFALWPVGANTALLLMVAFAYNNLTGRPYPHRVPAPPASGSPDPGPSARIGFTDEDLDAALEEGDQLLDVSRADLEAILRRTELRSLARRARATLTRDIMTRNVVAISPDASFREALELLRQHHVKCLPVTDEGARVLGILTQTDLLDKAIWGAKGPRLGARRRMRLTLSRGRAPMASVADIMTAPVRTVGPDDPIADIVPLMSALNIHHVPVTEPDGRLAGIVSQTDLVVALLADAARRSDASR